VGWPRDAGLPIMGALLRRISGAFFEFKYKKRESEWSVAERDDVSLEPAAGHRSARCRASAGGRAHSRTRKLAVWCNPPAAGARHFGERVRAP